MINEYKDLFLLVVGLTVSVYAVPFFISMGIKFFFHLADGK